ncbi:MAG TPA: GntR family transcriptional regulator [Methanocorpusculum sp.]|nr:GntR family transcriptional regulator [Methanocorpusculum sp.]
MTREELVNIIISNASDKPIYEQITAQIKRMIISGELPEGTALPSMRLLAKELRISVITTKRAYTDLERDGFIETVTGKGSFVAGSNLEIIKEEQMRLCEEHLQQAVDIAAQSGITYEELRETLELLYNGE